jgi:hypothetical protein
MIPTAAYQALTPVAGLQVGRTAARETEPVGPVADEDVDGTLPFLSRHVRHEHHAVTAPRAIDLGKSGPLGVEGLPLRSPIRHLLWTSRYVLPGLGLEGELLTGLRAADASDELRRKG